MKERFLRFFTGKLSKSIYIAVASAVVCGAVVIGSAVAVHNHNQEIQMENTASESVTEPLKPQITSLQAIVHYNISPSIIGSRRSMRRRRQRLEKALRYKVTIFNISVRSLSERFFTTVVPLCRMKMSQKSKPN